MKPILYRNLFISSQALLLAMIISVITASSSSRAVAAELITLDDGTPFHAFPEYQGFENFLQQGDMESDLLKVTSDAMNGFLMLKAVMDMNFSLQELKYVTSDNVTLDMPLGDLAKGVVLMKSGNYDVLKLVGYDLKPETGGNLDLVYLSDGIWNSYKSLPMSLTVSENVWSFQTRESNQTAARFNTMYLKKRTFFGKTIGLQSVTVGLDTSSSAPQY